MKLAKILRVATAPPIVAFLMLTILYTVKPTLFASLPHYLLAVLFLAVLPILAYPVAAVLHKGVTNKRSFERGMAIIFSVIGYIAGVLFGIFAGGTDAEKAIFMTYLISGVFTALLSFVFKVKSSGHACGVSGPAAMLGHCLGWPWLFVYVLLGVVFWCSLKMKRHTILQLIIGSIVPIAAMCASLLLVRC